MKNNNEEEDYPGEFKDILIKIFLKLIAIVSVILYFVMDISWLFPLVLSGLSYAYDYNLKRKKKK